MVSYAKRIGFRMLLVAVRCHVILRADVLRQTYICSSRECSKDPERHSGFRISKKIGFK
jgi:hypothetical protein